MKRKISQRIRIYLIGAIILLSGLSTSGVIYLEALNVSDTGTGFEFEDSKQYIHDLEMYGGKMNVLTVELNEWFMGLWHGKSLAYTIGCITVVISGVLFFIADHLPSEPSFDDRNEANRN